MARNQFTFYKSFWDAIKILKKKEDRLSALEAICAYALDGEELKMTDVAAGMFILIKPVLDTGERKSASGKEGGRKKQNGSKKEANAKQIEREKEGEKEGEVEVEVEGEVEIENECYISSSATKIAREAEEAKSKLGEIIEFYEVNIGMNIPSTVVTAAIQGYIQDMGADIVMHAMELTAEADKHEWRYVKGILDDYKANGFDTMEKILLAEKRWREKKRARNNREDEGKSSNVFAELLRKGVFDDEPE